MQERLLNSFSQRGGWLGRVRVRFGHGGITDDGAGKTPRYFSVKGAVGLTCVPPYWGTHNPLHRGTMYPFLQQGEPSYGCCRRKGQSAIASCINEGIHDHLGS